MTALSSIHQPTSRTWEKVSEGRAVGVDIGDIWISACGFVCEGLGVLGSQRVLAGAEAVAEEIGTKIVYSMYCYVSDFPMESGDGGFIFP